MFCNPVCQKGHFSVPPVLLCFREISHNGAVACFLRTRQLRASAGTRVLYGLWRECITHISVSYRIQFSPMVKHKNNVCTSFMCTGTKFTVYNLLHSSLVNTQQLFTQQWAWLHRIFNIVAPRLRPIPRHKHKWHFYRAMLCISAVLCRRTVFVRPSVRSSVCHVRGSCQNE